MQKLIQVGDVVKSLAGRDKDGLLLVVEVDGRQAKVVDGKARKTVKPKTKNVKHLQTVYSVGLVDLAENIIDGKPVGNERLRKAISAVKEKI